MGVADITIAQVLYRSCGYSVTSEIMLDKDVIAAAIDSI